jgi:hypothetical protein
VSLRGPAPRTPGAVVAAARREVDVRTRAARTERALRRAGRTGEPVLLGPFLGEIGYELLYWLPFVRRALREAGVDRDRTTVVTRGGAGLWYADVAAHAVDVLELVPPESFLGRLEERRSAAGDAKQLRVEAFDRELVERALARTGPATVVHPSLMWARLRGLWFRGQPPEDVERLLEYRPLDRPEPPEGLPKDYVALKVYFNDCLVDSSATFSRVAALVDRLAAETDVVLLTTGLALDDHVEWEAGAHVHRVDALLRAEDNLAFQTRAIAGARALVATYGGFSYLGAFLGVPTLTVYEQEADVPLHLEMLRRALPDARYERFELADDAGVETFLRGLA